MYKPTVEVLGVIEADGPGLRRARAWRKFWRVCRAGAGFIGYAAAVPFLIFAAVVSWLVSPFWKAGGRRLAHWNPTGAALNQVKREWKP